MPLTGRRLALAALLAGGLCACGAAPAPAPAPPESEVVAPSPPPPAPPPPASLYERLGKRDALDAIVDELLGSVLADKRINKLFDRARKDKEHARQLHARFVAELCVVTRGEDCAYDGKSMKDAHRGMAVNEGQWNAFVEDLIGALKMHGVEDPMVKELVDQLEQQTRGDIVTGKGK